MNQASQALLCFLQAVFMTIWLAAIGDASPGGGDFEQCGTLVQGPGCIQFLADDGLTYYIENLGPFGAGDQVKISGSAFGNTAICLPFQCTGSYDGCVFSNAIEPCVPAVLFCYGDGGVFPGCTPCPCGNDSPAGSSGGCLNSSGTSGQLIAFGEARVSADTLRLEARKLSPNTFAVMISGDNALPVSNPICPPGSGIQPMAFDGLRCVGGNFQRHGNRAIDSQGSVGETTPAWGPPDGPGGGLSGQGGFSAGQTRHFQIIYRDNDTLVCMRGLNTSNAAEVLFLP